LLEISASKQRCAWTNETKRRRTATSSAIWRPVPRSVLSSSSHHRFHMHSFSRKRASVNVGLTGGTNPTITSEDSRGNSDATRTWGGPIRSDSVHSPDLGTPRGIPGEMGTPMQSQNSHYGSKKDRYPQQQQSYVSSQAPGPPSHREREREKNRESISNGGYVQRSVSYAHSTPHSRPHSTILNLYDPAVLTPNQSTPRQGRSLLSSLSMRRRTPSPPSFVPSPLGNHSTPTVPDSLWFANDFQIGAGVVIIQPETGKIVLVSDKKEVPDHKGRMMEWERFFLPKGRKDVGESIEQAALREGYEEVNSFVLFHDFEI
jgi:hypothetical protein